MLMSARTKAIGCRKIEIRTSKSSFTGYVYAARAGTVTGRSVKAVPLGTFVRYFGTVNTKDVGIRTEAQVMRALLDTKGYVLLPYGENQRYDMVFVEEGRFCRVQCKTGRLRRGAVVFNTASIHAHRGKQSRG